MKKQHVGVVLIRGLAAGLAMLAGVSVATAHPYASHVKVSGGTVSFILNEDAPSVKVTFDNGAVTNNLGALTKGSNSFSLGAHTNYSIIVSKPGNGAFTQISSDADVALNFVAPRGVGVNRNPKRSYFGTIYICSPWPSFTNDTGAAVVPAGNGRTVNRGIYAVNADGSDAFGQGTNALLGNIALGASYRYSPYRVVVGPDDAVYVADVGGLYTSGLAPTGYSYSPPAGGLWMASPDFTTTTNVFDTNQIGTVYSGTYGLDVKGSVASNNLVILAQEWDLTGNDLSGANFLTPPAIWQYTYDSATNPIPIENAPPGLMTIGLGINAVLGDMAVHPSTGYVYAQQDRTSASGDSGTGTGETNNNNAELYVYDSTGVTNIWESGIGGPDIFDATYGIAISPDGNWLACATGFGTTLITHLTNGIPDLSTTITNNEESSPNLGVLVSQRRGVVFDAADNVITSLPQTPGGGNDAPGASLPAVVREYSLGFTSLAITSNDASGTNGSFSVTLTPLPQRPTITHITAAGTNVTLTWTSPNAGDTTSSFAVQSASNAAGPYSNVSPPATITQPGGAGTAFKATVPAQSPATFFRIAHL